VFNAQLLAIGNPDEKPPTAVEGHLQLKLYETEAGLLLGWMAIIVNPECEVAPTLGGGIYAIQDSEDFPNPEDPALVDLRPAESLGCESSLLEGVTGISAELAARLFNDPEEFTAVFFIVDGVKLAGTLQLGGPDTAPTR
jgi:FAD/FMN-containing dehydrogenase